MKLYSMGKSNGFANVIIGKCTRELLIGDNASDYVLVLEGKIYDENLHGHYAAVLTDKSLSEDFTLINKPIISEIESLVHLSEGDVVRLSGSTGQIKTLFRPASNHNVLFATDNCNSHCLMCSQPPKKKDDRYLVEENKRLIRLINPNTGYICISGGEPTLLKDKLFSIMADLRDCLPNTDVTMLSNGRMFCYRSFSQKFADVGHNRFTIAIPLYSDIPEIHNHVVQADDAFQETLRGYYNLGELYQRIELRVVLHSITYKRLPKFAEFIYRNLPFVSHIAFMGMEVTGYAKKNISELWVDPYDYKNELQAAVEFLSLRGLNVSIYNIPLCVLPKDLWRFARKSISDWKNIYADECAKCSVLDECGGFFKWSPEIRSTHIKAI